MGAAPIAQSQRSVELGAGAGRFKGQIARPEMSGKCTLHGKRKANLIARAEVFIPKKFTFRAKGLARYWLVVFLEQL